MQRDQNRQSLLAILDKESLSSMSDDVRAERDYLLIPREFLNDQRRENELINAIEELKQAIAEAAISGQFRLVSNLELLGASRIRRTMLDEGFNVTYTQGFGAANKVLELAGRCVNSCKDVLRCCDDSDDLGFETETELSVLDDLYNEISELDGGAAIALYLLNNRILHELRQKLFQSTQFDRDAEFDECFDYFRAVMRELDGIISAFLDEVRSMQTTISWQGVDWDRGKIRFPVNAYAASWLSSTGARKTFKVLWDYMENSAFRGDASITLELRTGRAFNNNQGIEILFMGISERIFPSSAEDFVLVLDMLGFRSRTLTEGGSMSLVVSW